MDYIESFISLILFAALIAALCLGIYLIVESIDQSFAEETFVGYGVLENKEAGTQRYYILVGKVLVPRTRDFWKVTFNFEGKTITKEVTQSCYQSLEKGQEIEIYFKKGLFSEGYYLPCE